MLAGWERALVFLAGVALQLGLVGLVLLRRPERQSSALAWILLVILLPGFGAACFFLFGDVRTGSRRRRRHREIVERVRAAAAGCPAMPRAEELADEHRSIANLGYLVGESEPRAGNRLALHSDTERFLAALRADIDAAAHHCHLLTYIYLDDESGRAVGASLLAAAARGVRCRLLVDAAGSKPFLRSRLRRELERGGVRVVAALPRGLRLGSARIDLRNHRKIALVDGRVAYTGSHNIAAAAFAPKPRFAPWVDATVRVEGPAVRDLQELFVQDWYMDTGETLEDCLAIEPPRHPGVPVQVIGTGPDSRHEAVVRLIQAAFHLAHEELILTTPYFVPDEGTIDALRTAAERGVRTVLVVPQRNDSRLVGAASRSLYTLLLESGVEIHEFTRGLLHAKTITVDRSLALVTTANLDRRSFELNYEASLVVFDSDFASQLRFLQRGYLDASQPIDAARWARRGWPRKIAQNAAGVFAPIL
jgi:cardiolipin synthase A/B